MKHIIYLVIWSKQLIIESERFQKKKPTPIFNLISSDNIPVHLIPLSQQKIEQIPVPILFLRDPLTRITRWLIIAVFIKRFIVKGCKKMCKRKSLTHEKNPQKTCSCTHFESVLAPRFECKQCLYAVDNIQTLYTG